MCITHDSFWALKSAFECVLYKWRNVMQHMKIQIVLSNGIWFAYICQPPGLALKIGVEIQNLRGLKSRLRLWHENPIGGVMFVYTSKQNKNISASFYWDKCSRWIHQRLQGFFLLKGIMLRRQLSTDSSESASSIRLDKCKCYLLKATPKCSGFL